MKRFKHNVGKITSPRIMTFCAGMCFLFPVSCYAELYFVAPSLVSSDPQMVADLSRFEKDGAQLPGDYSVDVYVNGKQVGSHNIRFITVQNDGDKDSASAGDIRDKTGLMACLTSDTLNNYGVNTDAFPALKLLAKDECISPGKIIPQAYMMFLNCRKLSLLEYVRKYSKFG